MTWAPPITISDGRLHHSRDGMPGITRLCDGSLLLVFEGFWDFFAHNRTERHHFSVQARQSRDEGQSWSEGQVIFTPPKGAKGVNAGSPQVISAGGGGGGTGGCAFFVSFLSDEHVGTATGNWVQNAETEVMRGELQPPSSSAPGQLVLDRAGRFVAGPVTSLWAGLSHFDNRSYVLFGHAGESYAMGPLENTTA